MLAMNTAEVNHSFGFIEMPNVHPVRKVACSTSSARVLAVDPNPQHHMLWTVCPVGLFAP